MSYNKNKPKLKSRRYIPTEFKLDLTQIPKQEYNIVTSDTTILLYISPMFQTALNAARRGRSSYESERNKSRLQRVIEYKLDSNIRGLIKRNAQNKPALFNERKMVLVSVMIRRKDDGLYMLNDSSKKSEE